MNRGIACQHGGEKLPMIFSARKCKTLCLCYKNHHRCIPNYKVCDKRAGKEKIRADKDWEPVLLKQRFWVKMFP